MFIRTAIISIFCTLAFATTVDAKVCTCGPNSGKECTSDDALCGADFTDCCQDTEVWDSGSLPFESVEQNFIGTISGKDLTCGKDQGICKLGTADTAAVGNECRSDNKCSATKEVCAHCDADDECAGSLTCSCNTTGCSGTCSASSDCLGYCENMLDQTTLDGRAFPCAANADCVVRGRMLITDSALQYCAYDGLRYVIQPRKLITFIDTLGNPQSGNVNRKICKNCTNGQKFTTLDLDTTIPYTPDSKYYSTSDDRIQIQKTGIYEITGQISMDDIEQSTSRGHDALEMKLERCHCSTYGSDNCDTENSDCEDTADGVKVNASGCKDDGTGVGDDTDLATNNNHAEQKWCVLDGGQAASYLNKKTRGSYSVTRTVFAKLNKYDFIRLRGMINDPKTAYGLLMPFGSFLKIEYVSEAYED